MRRESEDEMAWMNAAGRAYEAASQWLGVAQDVGVEYCRPSMMLKPKLCIDGNQWCALYGENLQDGVAGFGDSPALAYTDFDREWLAKLPAKAVQQPPTPLEDETAKKTISHVAVFHELWRLQRMGAAQAQVVFAAKRYSDEWLCLRRKADRLEERVDELAVELGIEAGMAAEHRKAEARQALLNGYRTDDRGEANAALIARAFNAHDDLLALLQHARSLVAALDLGPKSEATLRQYDAVIAKAEGQP